MGGLAAFAMNMIKDRRARRVFIRGFAINRSLVTVNTESVEGQPYLLFAPIQRTFETHDPNSGFKSLGHSTSFNKTNPR